MPFSKDFLPFVAGAPCAVLTRLAAEVVLDRGTLNAMFEDAAERQYEREWPFDLLVEIMLDVACGAHASPHAALKARAGLLPASGSAFYAKLGRMEPPVGEGLVAHAAAKAAALLAALGVRRPEPVPGFRTVVLDGNMPAGTDRRLKPLRGSRAAPLPGQVLALYECGTGLVLQAVPGEDAYAQERALLPRLRVPAGAHVLADRNFCTRGFLVRLAAEGSFFAVRRHGSFPLPENLERRRVGRNGTGEVFEAAFELAADDGTPGGTPVRLRVVTVRLDKPNRAGDREIVPVTNLPARVRAKAVARAYRERWSVERLFQRLTDWLGCEQPGPGQPRAALFAFAASLAASNLLAVVEGAPQAVWGPEFVASLSYAAPVDEVGGLWRGLLLALPPPRWAFAARLPAEGLAELMREAAAHANPARFRKAVRGPKLKRRTPNCTNHRHRSTHRVLNEAKNTP